LKGLFNPRREATAKVIEQAQKEGALQPRVPPLMAVDLLFGPIFYRRFIRQEPLSNEYVNQVYEYVMASLGGSGSRGGKKRRARRPRR
jgi:hypothetical protein